MSDNLPLEMQLEIMKRLPVKSLIQFRSVSKTWYSVITTSDFITSYNKAHHTHLLVRYKALYEFNFKDTFVSIVDDEQVTPNVSIVPPVLLKMLSFGGQIIGCSDGLLCICESSFDKTQMIAIIWNIAIRKEVAVVLYNVGEEKKHRYDLGFGVCPETSDPTVVKIKHFRTRGEDTESLGDVTCQVEVFKLSTGAWRSVDSSNLPPRISMKFGCVQVEGCLYWLARVKITLYLEDTFHNMLISLDLKSEEFNQVKLPGTLAYGPTSEMSLSKIRESLVVSEHVDNITFNIWMMEDDVPNLFTKLFTIEVNVNVNDLYASMRGFRNNGEPIVEISEDVNGPLDIYKLVVCDPYSKRNDNFGIEASMPEIRVHRYKETLLMLDQPNLKVYNELENRS